MARQLHPDDRQAIDMLLDRSRSAVGFAAESSVDPARLSAVSSVLHLLDNMAAEDPPADLMARTLDRVGAADHRTALPPALRAVLDGQQAHA